jgi:hypothetical protein
LLERAEKAATALRQENSAKANADLHEDKAKIFAGVSTLEARIAAQANLHQTRKTLLARRQELPVLLVEKILKPDESQFRKDAVLSGIDFVVGIIPGVGTTVDAFKKVVAIFKRGKPNVKIATKVVSYLDDYIEAVNAWLATAESSIRIFDECADDY